MPSSVLSKRTMRGPHFTVSVPDLLAALETLKLAVALRPPVPVLGGVLITQGVRGLELATFDYEISVRVQLDGPQPDYGRILVPHAELLKIVKGATKGEAKKDLADMVVRLDSEITKGRQLVEELSTKPGEGRIKVEQDFQDADITIEVGGFTMPLTALPVEDFPTLPAVVDPIFSVSGAEFLDQWTRVSVAKGSDRTLPMLMGVRAELIAGRLTLAGTDRFQLMVANLNVAQSGKDTITLFPPEMDKALKVLAKQGDIQVGIGTTSYNSLSLEAGSTSITLSPIESEFPRFRNLFPVLDKQTILITDRAALAKVLSKVIAMNTSRISQVVLEVGENSVTLVPQTERQEKVKGAFLKATVEGGAQRVGVDPDKLLELLEVFSGDTVALALDELKPILMANESSELFDEQARLRGLVMPVRLPG